MTTTITAEVRPVAICIPVRNEAARLPRLLAAIETLACMDGALPHLCFLLDSCTDRSDSILRHHRAFIRNPVHIATTAGDVPNAGKARHRAMLLGMEALGPHGGILLSTDADSHPRSDWLTTMVTALGKADVVAGQVVRPGASGEQMRLHAYYECLFGLRRRLDPVPWEATDIHHHASGANMGLSTAAYTALGGFPPLPQGEDARLVDEAGRAGLRVRRDAASVVVTSDRRQGRAVGGLAALLRRIDRSGLIGIDVAHPEDVAWQYRMHALARASYAMRGFDQLAAQISRSVDHLIGVARDCPNAEAFAMRIVPTPPGGMRALPFADAARALEAMLAKPVTARAA